MASDPVAPRGAAAPLPQLTALRFLAAMLVVGSHLTPLAGRPIARDLLHEGGCGVSFFYVLSGFVIAFAYAVPLAEGRLPVSRYALLRVVRLAPLHWLTAVPVILWLVAIRHDPPAPSTLVANLTMLHAWSPDPAAHYSLNGPSWSLSCELFFYAAFPVLVLTPVRRLMLLWCAMLAAILGGAIAAAGSPISWQVSATAEWLFYVLPATRLLEFVCGILLWHAYRRGRGRARALASTATEIALLAALPIVMAGLVVLDVPMPFRWQLAYMPVMAALVLVFAHGRGAISALLRHRLPVLLGEASFALYLTHRPIVTFTLLARERYLGDRHDAVLAIGLVAGCVLVSLAVLRWFDRPSQALLRGHVERAVRRRGDGRRRRATLLAIAIGGIGAAGTLTGAARTIRLAAPETPPAPTDLGINLFGLAPSNRQPVFANMIAQSEWFSSRGGPWGPFPRDQLDARGWVIRLRPGEVAPRPLMLPPAPFSRVAVRCRYAGHGRISAGGIATPTAERDGQIDLVLTSSGGEDEGAWIQIDAIDPADPPRDIDCRQASRPPSMLFEPAFVNGLRGFAAIRFLDWQRVNDNPHSLWETRTRPDDATQAEPGGVAIEDMIALAALARADPWFVLPYDADDAYLLAFARMVHDRLPPGRTVYVELGNEIWNDMFDAAQQARREGLALGLAPADEPMRAQMRRYAQKSRAALRIWTRVFADDPARLVRVVGSINAWPDMAEEVLGFEDTADVVDALATAPYIHLDLGGMGTGDLDTIFARLDGATDETLRLAAENRAIALRHGKRFLAYEGGQHLVTPDLDLARRIQRNPRMERVYARYLAGWRARIGGRLMLYASTAPIGEWGAWGLTERAGQPLAETPKLRAVRAFLADRR